MPNFSRRTWVIMGGGLLIFLCYGIIATNSHAASTTPSLSTTINSTPTTKVIVTTTIVNLSTTLSKDQKAQVVAILTKSTDHYKLVWKDGQTALGTTQYASAIDGVAAFDDPNSAASRFSNYRKKEDPTDVANFFDAFNQAEVFYTSSISDDALTTWRDDISQLTTDMGTWVQDAAQWQIQTITTSQLTNDAQIVSNDFMAIQKAIEAI